jgi:DNA primase catalytic core
MATAAAETPRNPRDSRLSDDTLAAVLEDVKRALPVETVLEASGTRLHRMGPRRARALCPFHQDRDPSLVVYTDEGRWHCFGCGARGDVVDMVRAIEGHDSFVEALRSAASRAGVPFPEKGSRRNGKPDPHDLLEAAATLYSGVLPPSAVEYLRRRGFPKEFVLLKRIGYAPERPRGFLAAHLKSRGVDLRLAETAGLVVRSGTTSCRDAFGAAGGGYIVLPVTRTGRVVDLQGRAFPDAQGRPKYLNLPGERRYLYGEDNLAGPWVLLCEGILDAMSAELAGLPACAVFGTNGLKEQHLAKFRRCSRIYVCFDRDATQKAATAACMFGTRGRVVILPDSFGEHGDLNDMLVAADNPAVLASTLHALMKRAPTGYEVRIDTLQCDDPYELYGAAAGLLAEIHRLDPISRGLLLKKLADRTGLPASLVEQAAREAAAHEAEVQKAAAAAAAT